MTTSDVRTCVGCRMRGSKSDLMRITLVATDQALRLVIDEKMRMGGRGAWVHPSAACVATALRRRAFIRALRATGPLDTVALEAWAPTPPTDMTDQP